MADPVPPAAEELPDPERTNLLPPGAFPVRADSDSTGFTLAPEVAAALPYPETISRYRVLREVARGGMGLILRATDPDLARGTLRFSLGHTSTAADVEAVAKAIGPAVERARTAGLT